MNILQRTTLLCTLITISLHTFANIDMQAHVGTDEGKQAYSDYVSKQASYYEDDCSYTYLRMLTGDELFARLNGLMGNTCKLGTSSYDYGTLRYAYVGVDRDLNTPGNIIGYYDGRTFAAVWDSGKTWNREHTWPQSKGANKSIPMGHDMQSVRPTSTSVNSSRGNNPYGEAGGDFYDPDKEVSINNPDYRKENLGSYRGDAARVILYDYIVYGEAGGNKNKLYNGNAQLLSKLGSSGVFESVHVLIKWHMQDPPSLTEMVRNDGAQDYQGNRNPFIDYPELAIQVFLDNSSITTYDVTLNGTATLWPNHQHTLSDGFIAYLTNKDGSHPKSVTISGAEATYDAQTGRLTVNHVTNNVVISTSKETAVEEIHHTDKIDIYSITGTIIAETFVDRLSTTLQNLPCGLYITRQGNKTTKISH